MRQLLGISGLTVSLIVLIGSLPMPALSIVPGKINYQGKLTDPLGDLIEGHNDISFSLFTQSVGGGSVWSELHSSVEVTQGLFNVVLGSTTALTDIFQAYDSLWLEITVEAERLVPRQELGSFPYALRVHGINVDPDGNVGIGTDSPSAELEVKGKIVSEVGGTRFHMVPRGGIMIWSQPLAEIPRGWQLCDGFNGTPDLRSRFLYGAGIGENPGDTGGTTSHTHTFSDTVSSSTNEAGSHAHSYSQVPSHSHTVDPPSCTSNSAGGHYHAVSARATSVSGGGHNHSINAKTTGDWQAWIHTGADWGASGTVWTHYAGNHNHTIDVGAASFSGADHQHSVDIPEFSSGWTGDPSCSTDSAGSHTHTLADFTVEGSTSSESNLPPYIQVAYIMRME